MNDSHTIAESTTSSSRPILERPSISTTTATMEDNGKAPMPTNGAHAARRPDEPIVKVQPPRREDLQPSYARVIEPDDADADTHGWYGGMVS